jgi:acyl-CoA thioesterase
MTKALGNNAIMQDRPDPAGKSKGGELSRLAPKQLGGAPTRYRRAMPDDLRDAIRVEAQPHAPGWYTGRGSDAWSFLTPSGGVLMSTALAAMRAEVGEAGFRLRSATTLFLSPVPAGPLEIRVEVLRRGNAAVQLRAALSSTAAPGPGLEVSATFARDREGPDVRPFSLPGSAGRPEAHAPFLDVTHEGTPAFFRRFDTRLVVGRRWWAKDFVPGGEAVFGRWYRYLVTPRDAGGRLDPLALPPIADTMPPALFMQLERGLVRELLAPSLDLTVHFLEDTDREWVYVHARSRRALHGYATADVELWDEDGRLLAVGAQTMMLRRQGNVLASAG